MTGGVHRWVSKVGFTEDFLNSEGDVVMNDEVLNGVPGLDVIMVNEAVLNGVPALELEEINEAQGVHMH